MTSGDRRLQRVGSKRASERFRTFERGEAATDEEWVPLPAVLIEEEDRLAGRSHARLGRQHRVTCNEDETKEIVTEISAAFRNRCRHLLRSLQLASDHLLLPLEPRVSAQSVDGAMFGCRHEPGARVVRNA